MEKRDMSGTASVFAARSHADHRPPDPSDGASVAPAASGPAVLIWDRTPTTLVDSGTLLARVAECERYAVGRGWEVVGTWIDVGEVAVTADVRPQLDVALSRVDDLRRDERGRERDVLLLVHSNDRLSNDALWAASLRGRIRRAGARLVLLVENTDTHVCELPGPPPPVAGAAVSGSAQ